MWVTRQSACCANLSTCCLQHTTKRLVENKWNMLSVNILLIQSVSLFSLNILEHVRYINEQKFLITLIKKHSALHSLTSLFVYSIQFGVRRWLCSRFSCCYVYGSVRPMFTLRSHWIRLPAYHTHTHTHRITFFLSFFLTLLFALLITHMQSLCFGVSVSLSFSVNL